jgi:hypothetical protein
VREKKIGMKSRYMASFHKVSCIWQISHRHDHLVYFNSCLEGGNEHGFEKLASETMMVQGISRSTCLAER